MKVAVGSNNPVKIEAVAHVLNRVYHGLEVIGLEVLSEVSDQPWGDEETRQGAVNRAQRALAEAEADLGVGLEGGIIETEYGLMTCAWCAIVNQQGVVGLGGGVNILLPPPVALALKEGRELGTAMDQLTGLTDTKRKMGAVGILTDGLSNRQEAYEHLVKMALVRFLSPQFYEAQENGKEADLQ